MRFASIVGARPQFIKLAPISKVLRRKNEEIIIHTGQHYDYGMSARFFEELSIPDPDYNLSVGSGSHGEQTGRMLIALEEVLLKECPDWVLLFGDTNSTLAGALAAAKLHLPIAHIEAGLRSFNREMPEEINRVVTDHLSQLLFCPTETARAHLAREGMTQGVEVVGDVMFDVLLSVKPGLAARTERLLAAVGLSAGSAGSYILVTVHRAANADSPGTMRTIARALNQLEMPVIFPVHPRTRQRMQAFDIEWGKHIHLIEPLGYLNMLALEQSAYRILTDSGGVQKEAFLLGVPCITLREETEWTETVELGWNILVGHRWQAILDTVRMPEPLPTDATPYGHGDAAEQIARLFEGRTVDQNAFINDDKMVNAVLSHPHVKD